MTIAIVDGAGVPLALHRRDGARLHMPDAACAKARTAAITRQATAELQAAVAGTAAFPGRMPLTGGLPHVHAGQMVGGVGSSGSTPEEDTAVCEAAVAALARLACLCRPTDCRLFEKSVRRTSQGRI